MILSGSDFTGATEVRFGAVQATGFTVDSATRLTATAPAGSPGTVAVSVTTPEGTSPASATAQFSYQADSASLQLAAGTVAMHLSGADCGFDGMPTNAAAPSSGAPPGFGFPYGQIAFKATGCTNGGTLRVALTLPRQVPPGAVLYKLVDGQWLPWGCERERREHRVCGHRRRWQLHRTGHGGQRSRARQHRRSDHDCRARGLRHAGHRAGHRTWFTGTAVPGHCRPGGRRPSTSQKGKPPAPGIAHASG